jgi:Flp pilus assembly protein TadG
MSRFRRRRSRSRGQAMVEFALIVPVLVLAVFGIIDFGRLVYTQNSLNEASREAARAGAVFYRPGECGSQDRFACASTIARNRLIGVIGTSTPVVTCSRVTQLDSNNDNELDQAPVASASNCQARHLLKVTVTNNFTLLTPLVAQFLGSQTLRGETQVTVQS